MTYTITLLGGPVSYQINNGPVTITPSPECVMVVLSEDGVELDRKEMGKDEKYSIAISGGKASLVIEKNRGFTVEIGEEE